MKAVAPGISLLLALAAFLCATTASAQDDTDAWQDFRPLTGLWRGEGEGFGNVSDVTHAWEFAVQGQYLRLETRSVTRQESGTGEVHEDVGYLSHDTDRASFVFRQFLSEGFVNTFDVSVKEEGGTVILFGDRESESAGGMRVRMRLEFLSDTEYEMVLDLAMPDGDFATCQRMRMKKAG
jgi:hypothetical protein